MSDILPPVDVWIEETSPDEWLVDCLESYLEVDSTWTHAVAAGTFDRLHRDRDESRERLQSILDVEMETPTRRLQAWLSGLDASELEAVFEAFVLEVIQVQGRLEEVRETIDPDDQLWLTLLHERDDLASVRRLLLEANRGEGLDEQLQALDEQGWRLVRSCPSIPELHDDPRLRRASLRRPDAWWVFPVSDRDPDLKAGDPS